MNDKKRTFPERRQFLKRAAATSAVALLEPFSRHRFAYAQRRQVGDGKMFVTNALQRHESTGLRLLEGRKGDSSQTESVRIDSAKRFQTILGFGSAYTDASCFLLNSMPPDARQKFLLETFSPKHMNLNAGRTSIGASDYSRDLYNYDDTAGDVMMQHFSIAHDESYILPILREMRQINPELFLLSSPWSPPGWMKTYGSMLGGWMTHKYLAAYALYVSRFLDAYRMAGVPIEAVTTQNELETDQDGSMPATYWPPELEADFIRDHLGPLLKQKPNGTAIWLLDHNYSLWKRVRWQMRDPELRKYVDGVAWHGYVGTPDMMSRLHEAEPQLPFYWTEGGPDVVDPKYATEWTRWGDIFSAAMANWCRCVITWNLMLDPQGKPNIGPFQCGGLVTLKNDESLTYSGQYWALRHFSQHVRRGAVRIASHCDASELTHIAFENQDGSRVLVLTNNGEERELRLIYVDMEATVRLDKNSMATIVA